MSKKIKNIETFLIHGDRDPSKYEGMVNPPIYKTTTVIYDDVRKFLSKDFKIHTDITYGRSGTPTVHELEKFVAELDGVKHAIITPSGLSAIVLVALTFLRPGDHILVVDSVYKGTRRYLEEELKEFGVEVEYYDSGIGKEIEQLFRKNTKMLFLESPGSGTFEMQDVPLLTRLAKKHKIISVIDNTWATPIFFKPLQHGCDISIQSGSKYYSGHSDVFMGIITMQDKWFPALYKTFRNYGVINTPDNAYMVLRSMRTLHLRLQKHQVSVLKIAKWLEKHPKIKKVLCPALPSFKGYKIWKRDFSGVGSVFSFNLKTNNENKIYNFINQLKFFSVGLSWGGYESLIIPYKLQGMRKLGYNKTSNLFLRVHIGLENYKDLIEDLDNALKNIKL
jgi:cystathionine beta-lyase